MRDSKPPREIADLYPMNDPSGEALSASRRLKKLSNVICLCLMSQQLIAILVEIGALILYFAVNLLLFQQNPGVAGLQDLTATGTVLGELVTTVTYFAYMFIPFILIVFILRQNPFSVVPVGRIRSRALILPAIAVALLFAFFSDLLTQYIGLFLSFLHLQASSPDFTPPASAPAFLIYFFQICILAPLCEEFIFRGVILQNLRRFGNAFAIVISALLFCMVHGNLLQIPLALLMGLVFGVFVIESGSIWLTVLLHACVNTFSVLLDELQRQCGGVTANFVYITVVIFSGLITAGWLFRLHRARSLAQRFAACKESRLPNQFMFKRFALTPGFLLFTAMILLFVTLYMTVI